MFQFKNTGLGMKEPDASSAIPNTFGKVRTFKEDLENFEKGAPVEKAPETMSASFPEAAKPSPENLFQKSEQPHEPPAVSHEKNIPNNPFQSVPTPPPLSSANSGLPAFKSSPAQSFFAEKPPARENILPTNQNQDQPPVPPAKAKSKIVVPLVTVLVLAAAGAGLYYYWFHLKNNSSTTASVPAATQPASAPAETNETAAPTAQNQKLRQLVVDTTQNPLAIKEAVQKFAADFSSSSSDGNIAEVKLIGKDNQPIGKKDFTAGFGLVIPDAVLMKLSEDYSLFVTRESSNVRLGLAFKTVTSAGLADEMKNWEPKITTDLGSLYLIPSGAPANSSFTSSRYKNADIRYINFSSPADTSLDYSVISNFLVISASKDSTRTIMDYMSEK